MEKLRQGMSGKGFVKVVNANADELSAETKLKLSVKTPASLKKALNEQAGAKVISDKTAGGYSKITSIDGTEKEIKGIARTYNESLGEAVVPTKIVDLASLKQALADGVTSIALEDSIISDEKIVLSGVEKFDGNGNIITFTQSGQNLVATSDCVIENLVVVNEGDHTKWDSTYGLQLYNGDFIVRDCLFTGCNAGLLVNSSTAKLEGTIEVSDNTFGGIEVSKSSGLDKESVLDLNGAVLVNTSEEYAKPTIWTDGEKASVLGADDLTANTEVREGQIQYYLVEDNAVAPVTDDEENIEE